MQLPCYEIEAQSTSNRVILKTKLFFYSYAVTLSMKIRYFQRMIVRRRLVVDIALAVFLNPSLLLFSPVQVEISSLTAESQSYQQQVSEVLFQYCVSSEAEVLFALKL